MATTDPWLTKIYGTGGGEDDLEKTAQMHILAKLAEEEGVDLSGLDDQQLEQLYQHVSSGDEVDDGSSEVYADDGVDQEELLAKEAQAKFEEADFLGRVMAHSFTQEMDKVAMRRETKEGIKAGKIPAPPKGLNSEKDLQGHLAHAGNKRKLMAANREGRAKPGNITSGLAKLDKAQAGATSMGARAGRAAGGAMGKLRGAAGAVGRGAMAAGRHVGRNPIPYAIGAAGAGVAASNMHKEASAFEKLALEHAANILQANGIDPSTGAPMQQDPQAQFGQALDQRALEILQENGYDTSSLVGDEGQDDGFDGGQGQGFDPSQGGMQA